MGKYTSSNRLLRRTILKQTGLTVLKSNDPRIDSAAELVSSKKGIPARELARQYRHYCNRLVIAFKDHLTGLGSLEDIAKKHHVCHKLLSSYATQMA